MADLISEAEVKSLSSAINRRYGLDFTNYEIKSLKRGFARLMMKHHLKSSLELWSKVLNDAVFFKASIDELMVNLTELFRNPDAWEYIRDNIFTEYFSQPIVKIWHAGCSTGEEVYTSAIILEKLGMLGRTRALSTDLSSRALKKAQEGAYSLTSLSNYRKSFAKMYPGLKLEDFFDIDDKKGVIRDKYKKYSSFQRHNLVQDSMDEKFDIIFCRNVMIYFDEQLKKKVIDLFHSCLNPNGILIIGYYDVMPDSLYEYFEVFDSKTRVYKKKIKQQKYEQEGINS